MPIDMRPSQALRLWHDVSLAIVRENGPDLSPRQITVLLTVYLGEGPHTVRGLASDLNVSKPAITRALDRLGELDLARRKVDPADRRSVLVQRTPKGSGFLQDLKGVMTEAAKATGETKILPAPVVEAPALRAV